MFKILFWYAIISLVLSAVVWFLLLMVGVKADFSSICYVVGGVVGIVMIVLGLIGGIALYQEETHNSSAAYINPGIRTYDDRPSFDQDYIVRTQPADSPRHISDCAVCGQADRNGMSMSFEMKSSMATSRLVTAFGQGVGQLQPTSDPYIARVDVCSKHTEILYWLKQAGKVRYDSLAEKLEELKGITSTSLAMR